MVVLCAPLFGKGVLAKIIKKGFKERTKMIDWNNI